MPYLVTEGEARAIGPGVLTVGSGTEAAWRFVGKNMRPIHAVFVPEADGSVSVTPGDAHTELLLNGHTLSARHRLALGDTLEMGDTRFMIQEYRTSNAGQNAYLRDMSRNRVFKLEDHNLIGRDFQCRVMLTDPDVSRRHAEITRENEHFFIRPSGAAVTMVNGERLADRRALQEGDELSFGRAKLRFSRETPSMASVVSVEPGRGVRSKREQTSFFGAVQLRDRMEKEAKRRVMLLVMAAVIVVAVAVWIFR